MGKKFNLIQYVEDDGLKVMDVGNWAQKKYKLVGQYCDIFTKGMKNKWNLIYLDLFSGPGYVKNKQSNHLLKNSALISLTIPQKFNYYIFNDYDKESAIALEKRIKSEKITSNFEVLNKDANIDIDYILSRIPNFKNGKENLIFSFIDPFSLNLDFNTIKKLSEYRVDILMLHALQMDARRNFKIYLEEKNEKIASFTGNPNWRESFYNQTVNPSTFMKFVSDEFDRSIQKIGYQACYVKEKINNNSGLGIYYLSFYSKHELGLNFFEKIRKGSKNQYELF